MDSSNSKDKIRNQIESDAKELQKQLAKKLIRDDRFIREFSTKSASFHVPHESSFGKEEVRKRKVELLNNVRDHNPLGRSVHDSFAENRKKLTFTGDDISHTSESTYTETTTIGSTLSGKTQYVLSDLNQLIELVKTYTDGRFLYLTHAMPKSSPMFTPYSLIEVPFNQVDRNQYYAISRQGITFWSATENHFTKLSEWKFEYHQYCYLMNIKLFKTFRIWKGFIVWRKTLQWQKYKTSKAFIRNNLFIAIPHLGKALLQLQSKLSVLKELIFTDVENTRNLLLKFRNVIKITLFHACYKALIDKNFSPEDEMFPSVKKMKEKLTSIEQANKRRYCALLRNFLSVCDYKIQNIIKLPFIKSELALKAEMIDVDPSRQIYDSADSFRCKTVSE